MATAYLEAPPEWGASRLLLAALVRAGYSVQEEITIATRERRLLINPTVRPRPPGEAPAG